MNLNYLFNKAYYEELPGIKNFFKYNNTLINCRFSTGENSIPFAKEKNYPYLLKVVYPGLLIGIGNTHDAGSKYEGDGNGEAEIKLGFTLDYVTGLPVIPGSTVKGILRRAFKYTEYIAEELSIDEMLVGDIENLIFEEGTERVVFFDAIPIEADKNNHLLGLDNITPHSDQLKNPKPLSMLKVMPNVVFLFRFGFENWEDSNSVKREQLQQLFKQIMIVFGVGAKTNVGFGTVIELEKEEEMRLLKSLCYLEKSSG